MSGYRRGDKRLSVLGAVTRLRLTNSALADIASALNAETPKALAERLRQASVSDWNSILQALSNPRPKQSLSQAELLDLMPGLSAVIIEGLTP